MAADQWSLLQKQPSLRFYGWAQETLSVGKHQTLDPALNSLQDCGIPLVRRPTGGRAVLHGDPTQELTYALVIPGLQGKREDIYHYLCEFLRLGLASLGIPLDQRIPRRLRATHQRSSCFATQTAADLTYQGQKIIGSAQRWEQGVVLQQGSILLQPNRDRWADLWPQDPHAVIGIHEVLGSAIPLGDLIQAFTQAATLTLGIDWIPSDWTAVDLAAIEAMSPVFEQ